MSHWYALSDLPQVRAHVRLWWTVHGTPVQVEAVRSWQQRSRSWGWVTLKDGELQPLPPRGREKSAWAPDPVCWQPVSEGWTWPGEAPEPISPQEVPLQPHRVPRLVGTSYASQAVSDAEAAEMAREMEGDREAARARNDGHAKEDDDDRWWWKATVKYEPAGEISPRWAEARVLRALAWCGAGDTTALVGVVGSSMNSLAMTAAEAATLAEIEWNDRKNGRVRMLPRFDPLPPDRDDFPIAMSWFTALNPPENWGPRREAWSFNRIQRVMLMRTLGVSLAWADIGFSLGVSGPRARQLYVRGMEMCHRVANGGAAYPGRKVVDQIAALKERNREHRRGA